MKNRIWSLTATLMLALTAIAAEVKTNRSWYLAGEAMSVSITTGMATPHSASSAHGSIAYAELSDTRGVSAGVVVSLQRGMGSGIIELPPTLHSGYYALSVYTRHQAQVTHQLVAVINPLRKSADDDIEWIAADSCWVTGVGATDVVSRKAVDMEETEGHIVKAHVSNIFDGQTFTATQIRPVMSIIGKQIHYFEGTMLDDTTAVFNTYGVHGKLPLVLSARTSTGVALPIEMSTPLATLIPKQLPHLVFHYQRQEVEDRSLDMQRHQLTVPSALPLAYDNTLFGAGPDMSYNLDEYRQFPTVREALIEYVTDIVIRDINGTTQLLILREQGHYNSLLTPLVLIDGMPVSDTERLLRYDARRIHYINIYGGQYTFGHTVYDGIVSFVTRSGQLTNYPTERNMQYLVYDFPQ